MMEKNNINIELAKEEELNEINKIAKQVHDLHVEWRSDIFYEVEEVISKEMFNQLIENNQIYVVKEENSIIRCKNNDAIYWARKTEKCIKEVNIYHEGMYLIDAARVELWIFASSVFSKKAIEGNGTRCLFY